MNRNEKVFKWNNCDNHFLKEMKMMRVNGVLVDVTLWCEKRKIKAHKCVLAAASPYFRLIFEDAEHPHPIIVFKTVEYEALADAVNYIYDGTVTLKQPRWKPFIDVAEMLELSIDANANELLNVAQNEERVNQVAPAVSVLPFGGSLQSARVIGKHVVRLRKRGCKKLIRDCFLIFVDQSKLPSQTAQPKVPLKRKPCEQIQNIPPPKVANVQIIQPEFGQKVTNVLFRCKIRFVTVKNAVAKLRLDRNVYTSDHAQIIINITFDHAIRFTDSVSVYSTFLEQIMNQGLFVGKNFDFKVLLNKECSHLIDELSAGITGEDRVLGIVHLFGALYLDRLFCAKGISKVLDVLMPNLKNVEYAVELLEIVGERIENRTEGSLDDERYCNMFKHYAALRWMRPLNVETKDRILKLLYRNMGWKL